MSSLTAYLFKRLKGRNQAVTDPAEQSFMAFQFSARVFAGSASAQHVQCSHLVGYGCGMGRVKAVEPLRERMPDKRVTDAPVNLRPTVTVEDHSHLRVDDHYTTATRVIAEAIVNQGTDVGTSPLSNLNSSRFQSGKHPPQPFTITFPNAAAVRTTSAYKAKKSFFRELNPIA
nr:hypothetical protein [Burkholderia vietnamiensis]